MEKVTIKRTALTTVDNPYDPFENFNAWFTFDSLQGYNTCGLIARFSEEFKTLTAKDESIATEIAIDSIIENDLLGIYKKLTKEVELEFVPFTEQNKKFEEEDEAGELN